MTVTAVDADGNAVAGFRGTVYITQQRPGRRPSTPSPTRSRRPTPGTHSFTGAIRLVTGGDQTVTVSAPYMAPLDADRDRDAGAVTSFAVSAPAATTAGDTFSVTVSALDALGDVATGYSSTIHFTSSDAQAGLPADYTFTPDDAGVHTFTVTLKSAGSRFVGATEVGGTITGGANVDVTPGAAAVVRPGRRRRGHRRRPAGHVVARDVYGNIATGYSGTVHVTSSDPAAVLPADTALVNGVATVNVTLLTVGTQTITATDVANPALTGTVSSDATPPVAALFAVSGYPATTAGVANTFTVTVRDTIGQVATGYTGTVYFSSSDVQAGLPASYTFTAADAGVHTFTATLRTAGTQSITVRDVDGRPDRQPGRGSRSPRPRSPASGSRSRSAPTARATCWSRPATRSR